MMVITLRICPPSQKVAFGAEDTTSPCEFLFDDGGKLFHAGRAGHHPSVNQERRCNRNGVIVGLQLCPNGFLMPACCDACIKRRELQSHCCAVPAQLGRAQCVLIREQYVVILPELSLLMCAASCHRRADRMFVTGQRK